MKRNILVFIFSSLAILAALNALHWCGILPDNEILYTSSRLLILSLLAFLTFKRSTLTAWILFAIVAGAELGHDLPSVAVNLKVLSKIFIQLIKTIIAPLLFATLVVGIAGHSNIRQVGRMGWKSLLYFEIVTTIALFIGLLAINVTRAGEGVDYKKLQQGGLAHSTEWRAAVSMPVKVEPPVKTDVPVAPTAQSWDEIVLHIFPENIAKSIVEGQVLQIVIFSIIFGIALALLSDDKKAPMLKFCESLSETMFKFTNLIMYFAPIGVGAAIAYTVGHMGLGILVNLFKLLMTLYAALFFFMIAVLLPIALMARIPILKFAKTISEPVSIAFATTSSEAALPAAMERLEEFGVPRKIIAFVLPTGYSFNLDGTTLYLALASVFVAQAAHIDMSWQKQVMMMLTLMLTSKGVAGVPRASLVILMGTASQFGLPLEIIFIILGIDELMDMARTSVNVIGNCLAAVVIAKWEGEFDLGNE